MNLTLYPRLSTRSKKALTRKTGHWGKPYNYRPRGILLQRLARETDSHKTSLDAVRKRARIFNCPKLLNLVTASLQVRRPAIGPF
jgi:hypothetical protein